jgi:ribosome biogenesis GTPase
MVEPDGESSAIVEILPRRNYVIRRASNLSKESHIIAANIDRALLIVTLHSPSTPKEFVDRFLVTCEAYKVPVTIVLGKADTLEGEYAAEAEEFEAIYTNAGYEVLRLSSTTGDGVEQIRQLLHNKTTLVAGNSGVGKSSILNALEPGIALKTGDVSEKLGRGRHTTRHVELFRLSCGAVVADTPGFSSFETDRGEEIQRKEELQYAFREFRPYIGECQFQNCAHIKEKGCAVLEAVRTGEICPSRHQSYVRLYDQAKSIPDWQR